MKNIPHFLIFLCLLVGTASASGQKAPGILLLDSVYSSNWVSNNWSLNLKNYRLKNGSGKTVQSLFLKYNADSSTFLDYARFLYSYPGNDSTPGTITNQLWYAGTWNTLQYTHNLSKDVVDTSYTKNWSNQHHTFISGSRNISQYNDSLLVTENLTQSWDTATQTWTNLAKNTYTYTTAMKPQEQILQSWENSTSSWINVYKYSNVYDANNLLVTHLEYEWNDTAVNWSGTLRNSFYYNPASFTTLVVNEYWNQNLSEWDSIAQTNYIYNGQNWLMTISTKNFYPNIGHWMDSYLIYYTYFPTGEQRTWTSNVWDTVHSTWFVNAYQKTDSATGQIAESFTYTYNQLNFTTTGGNRNLYTYNGSSDTLTIINQSWDLPGSTWLNKSQELYTYETHNLLSETLTQNWATATSTWENAKKSDYYYSEFIGINEHQAKSKPCFYANPMVAGSAIYCPDFNVGTQYILRLCSLTGSEVYRSQFLGGESVKIPQSITSGLYLLIIEQNNAILYKDKVIVLH
jgi:hypothetical protein